MKPITASSLLILSQSRLISSECALLLIITPDRPKLWDSACQHFSLSRLQAEVSYAVNKSWWIKSKGMKRQRTKRQGCILHYIFKRCSKRPTEQMQIITHSHKPHGTCQIDKHSCKASTLITSGSGSAFLVGRNNLLEWADCFVARIHLKTKRSFGVKDTQTGEQPLIRTSRASSSKRHQYFIFTTLFICLVYHLWMEVSVSQCTFRRSRCVCASFVSLPFR